MLERGDVVAGKFRIEGLLAEGGMGAVFRARHLETERSAALKVLWPDVQHSELHIEKFQLEAKVAALVQSDHIVSVLDAGFDAERAIPYLAMELLEGCTLRELALPVEPATVALYLAQLASALDKAHGYVNDRGEVQPIVHCDLKPDNVFLTHRESGVPEIKILDFGMARMAHRKPRGAAEVRGTPLYMATEQIRGEALSPQTDVWAMGLISFFLLTGKSYWRAGSSGAGLTELLTEILSLPISAPRARAAELGIGVAWPVGYDDWFLRCLRREPSERFASAGEGATEFARVFGVLPTQAGSSRHDDRHGAAARAVPVVPSSVVASSPASVSARDPGAPPGRALGMLSSQPTERLDSMTEIVAPGSPRYLEARGASHRARASQHELPARRRGARAAWLLAGALFAAALLFLTWPRFGGPGAAAAGAAGSEAPAGGIPTAAGEPEHPGPRQPPDSLSGLAPPDSVRVEAAPPEEAFPGARGAAAGARAARPGRRSAAPPRTDKPVYKKR